ncbi:hypothetical protein AB0D86_49310 [Streptomyces sp. NPDC048324]|uniref:hypothetical protein n=1 Tax=Streptomyces sp. NPDC048324 TaxID=3157205 RepID=UPI00343A42FF
MASTLPLARIRDEAERFRLAIQTSIAQDGLADVLTAFRNFPRGSCGKATAMMCVHLNEADMGPWEYVMGRQGSPETGMRTHAWAALNGYVLDITGSQFPDRPEIWLAEPDAWFSQWESGRPRRAHWSQDPATEEGRGLQMVLRHL